MELLDRLVRDGEYLPLALTFLGGVFRMALTAREQNLRGAADVQSYFQRMGLPMWRSRAEQIHAASGRFSKEKLEEGISLVFKADRDMKGSRPDDRIVMEDFVFRLTG
jgi:DNA polymerase-3 subunit delta